MNLASAAGEVGTNMLFVNFNQDCTSLAVGTKAGNRGPSLLSARVIFKIWIAWTSLFVTLTNRLESNFSAVHGPDSTCLNL